MAIKRAMNFGSWKVSYISLLWKAENDIFALLGWYLFNVILQENQKSLPCKQPYDLQEAVKRNVMALSDTV